MAVVTTPVLENMDPMHDDVYKTSDQGLAAYFMECGFFCAGAVPGKAAPERWEFIFIDVPDPKQIEDDWYRYRKGTMSARSYFEKLRTIRHLLREAQDKA